MPSKLFSPEMDPTTDFIPVTWPPDHIITLRVGNSPTLFHVHKILLIQNSPFFQNALRHDWREAREHVVDLPEDAIQVVQSWALWLYNKHLFTPAPLDDKKNDTILQPFLCQCYAFGDKIQDRDFKDAVIDAYIMRCQKTRTTSFSMIRTTYAHTTRTSPARQVHVDLALGSDFWAKTLFEKSRLRKIINDIPQDFQVDLMAGLAAVREFKIQKSHVEADFCAYHEHGVDQICYKQKRPINYLPGSATVIY